MAGYSVICGQCRELDDIKRNQREFDYFMQRPEVLQTLTEAKKRYRECFLALVSAQVRPRLREVFNGEDAFLDDVRYSLALSEERVKNVGFFYDRICEWQVLCNSEEVPFLTKEILLSKMEESGVQNDDVLFKTLEEIAPYYLLRRLQVFDVEAFTRIGKLLPLLNQKTRGPLRVYEYGCGAADIGLYFARKGHRVAVCDVKFGVLPLVRKRFEMRNLEAQYVGASVGDPIPDVDGEFELVAAIEVLEHVRSPLVLLEKLDSVLSGNGFALLGSFPFADTTAVGDHLSEAIDMKDELLRWIRNHWQPVRAKGVGNTFTKKKRLFFRF